MISVYQHTDFKDALKDSEEKIITISNTYHAVEKTISTPFGERKILEARGTPSTMDAKEFMKLSKSYFYGTISPCVLDLKPEMFYKIGFKRVINNTILIDLRKDEEELMKNLEKKSARWGVRKAEKEGLKFEAISNDEEFKSFYKMYRLTAKNGGFKAESYGFIKKLVKSDIAKLFVIKKKEKVVAGGMILIDKSNNYSILDLTSSTDEGLKLQAMPFLYWNLMTYSKKQGLEYFDLGGYDKEAKEGDKTHNINKFKERFGGIIKEQPIYSSNWKYPFFRGLMKKMRILKRLYKK